jgi:DNA (cytosine-5)-methyltransferase 1
LKAKRLKTVSLFSGGGGLDLGFSAAGYSIMLANDIDPYSCKTIEINKGKKNYLDKPIILNEDIQTLTPKKLQSLSSNGVGKIDVVIGGPPCQAFSVFGRRKGLKDPRGNLIWEYIRIINHFKPKVFVFENVDGLKTIHQGVLYDKLLKELSLGGKYHISDHIYNVAEYGIPQHRTRVFLIGTKNKKEVPRMAETHGENGLFNSRKPYVTVRQALSQLGRPGEDDQVFNHVGRKHSERIIKRYASLKFGERDHKTRINKLHPDKPSFTIIVGSDAGGGKGHIHPFDPREVTPRESARIQTFPDWWEFYGKGRHIIRQVGNAVPPLFAALLAEHIKRCVFNLKSNNSYEKFVSKLELPFLNGKND